ncbi:hypothetical protein [Paraburkholderia ferrariae]|uniref:Uncharacterized protein n=1 Tax=Paraburkholderia ferrariae TaxID=386056 RepID=A0ABU9RLZ8_9BURK
MKRQLPGGDALRQRAPGTLRNRLENAGHGDDRTGDVPEQGSRSRAEMKAAHRILLRRSKEENGLARSSSPAMLRGKQIETRSMQPIHHRAHCQSWI